VGKRVLDGACGCGYGSLILDAANYVGIDAEQENVSYGHHHYGSPSRQFYLGNLETLREHGRFDAIISFETIEHLKDPKAWLDWAAARTDFFIGSTPIRNGNGLHSQHHIKEYEALEFDGLLVGYWPNLWGFYQTRYGISMAQPPHEHDPIRICVCWR
jgi:cyclopropane fatty-acyl-phospholipid synthase-like methyltransferase